MIIQKEILNSLSLAFPFEDRFMNHPVAYCEALRADLRNVSEKSSE